MKQPEFSVTQIAEELAGERSPTEIMKTIIAQRSSLNVAELTELLDRAKELQVQAEKLQRKANVLMDIVEQIVKASPELAPATIGELDLPGGCPKGRGGAG